jgi:hypothetical protein
MRLIHLLRLLHGSAHIHTLQPANLVTAALNQPQSSHISFLLRHGIDCSRQVRRNFYLFSSSYIAHVRVYAFQFSVGVKSSYCLTLLCSHCTSSKVLLFTAVASKPSDRSNADIEWSHQQRRYCIGPRNEDPFFKPEGEASRTKRLNNELDSLLTLIQFPKKPESHTRTVRSPSLELMARLDPRAYLASEKSKIHRKERMLEMDQALTHVRGSTKRGKKGKKTASYKSDVS